MSSLRETTEKLTHSRNTLAGLPNMLSQ